MSSLIPLNLEIPPPTSVAVNPRKRVLEDSEDTEERDPKRSRPADLSLEKGKQKWRDSDGGKNLDKVLNGVLRFGLKPASEYIKQVGIW